MSRRLLRASLAAVLLLSPVARISAQPPDLPIAMRPSVGPLSDQSAAEQPKIDTGETPYLPTLFSLRPREVRQIKASLLTVVNPLLVLTPLMDEKCDRGGDQAMTIVNGVMAPVPVEGNAFVEKGCDFLTWVKNHVPRIETRANLSYFLSPSMGCESEPTEEPKNQEIPSNTGPCPYLTEQKKSCPVVTGNVDLENSVLANLDRLIEAEKVYEGGEAFQKNGDLMSARACYIAVQHMCPGSELDERAAKALAAVQSRITKTPTRVVVAITVECGAQRLHEEAVKRAQARAAAAASEESKRELEIRQKLSELVSVHCEDQPLVKVIENLGTFNNLNIYIDKPALWEEGVNLDQPVSIDLNHVSLKSALGLVSHQAHLTWIIKDEVVWITTPGVAEGPLMTRIYPVAKLLKADLPGTGSPQERLIKLITEKILPRKWDIAGGAGTIDYYSASPGLIVNQTEDIHKQIADLLADLRRQQVIDTAIGVTDASSRSDPKQDVLQKGTRLQMTYLKRACQQTLADGRFDKAVELATETLALDETGHCLSYFGRVYLMFLESECAFGK